MTDIELYAIQTLHMGGESVAEDDTDEDGNFEKAEDHRAACDLSIKMAHAVRDNPQAFLEWFRAVSA